MLTATSQYRAAVARPVRREVLMRVFHAGVDVTPNGAAGVPLSSGSVTASLNSRIVRNANWSCDSSLFPEDPADLLAPEIAVAQISAGIGYGDGSREIFPVFTGRVQAASEQNGLVTFRGDDLAADVIAMRFERPERTLVGNSVVSEIQRFISQALPSATFGTNDVIDAPAPNLIWDDDRGRALDELATSLQGRWYALGDGSFVVRRYPYDDTVPVIVIGDGRPSDGAGRGMISQLQRSVTRDGVLNSVTVLSERIDGDASVMVTARNTDPGSPTFYGDGFGRVSAVIRPQTPVTAGTAQLLAQRQLNASTALLRQMTVTAVPDATLEPGDVVRLLYRGQIYDQVIDSLTLPLTVEGTMTINTRSVSEMTGEMVS